MSAAQTGVGRAAVAAIVATLLQSVAASLKKVLAAMDGVTIASTKSLSAYEKSKLEAKSGKVNHYSSVDELFAKVGL